MFKKDFIFIPGFWLGEGKISFSHSSEFLKFYTKWQIKEKIVGVMVATQIVEIQGVEEHTINTFTFQNIQEKSFTVFLENEAMGHIEGKGLIDQHVIAWEFKKEGNFEGFEVYEQQENGDYFIHAEYGSANQFRTIIEGLIWYKGLENSKSI